MARGRGPVDFFLTEAFDVPLEVDECELAGGALLRLPTRDRKPVEPGFELTWREYPAGGGEPYERTGVVLHDAPRQGAVWVQPKEPRDGEGVAVVVDGVVEGNNRIKKMPHDPVRYVGGPGDELSTARWQKVGELPRAWLRVDQRTSGDGARMWEERSLHSVQVCPPWQDRLFGSTVVPGEPVQLADVWVFDRDLHPQSRVPGDPRDAAGRRVQACRRCLPGN